MMFCCPPSVHVRVTDEETILLDESTGRFHGLNSTASLIWQSLTDGGTVPEAATTLSDAYDISMAEALTHVDSLVETLVNLQLMHRSDDLATVD